MITPLFLYCVPLPELKNGCSVTSGQASNYISYSALSLLNQQEMHRSIGNDYESARKHGEADNVLPKGQIIKAKCA